MRVFTVFVVVALCFSCKTSGTSAVKDDAQADQTPEIAAPHVCTDPSNPGSPLPCASSIGTPELTYAPTLLDNLVDFSDPFYGQFNRHQQALTLDGGVTKNYWFPTFYRDVTTSIAMFYCSYAKAQQLFTQAGIPASMTPVSMGLGRTLIIFTSYRYNDVFGIPGYNEVAISIPTITGHVINVPILPLLVSDFKGLGFYVMSMPVTTQENWIRGHKIWGLPKAVQEIDMAADGGDYVTTVHEQTGEVYLQFRVPMSGHPLAVNSSPTYLYSILNKQVRRSTSTVSGNFVTTKWDSTLAVPGIPTSKTYATFGNSPSGLALQNLDIEPAPFQVRFSAGTESVFDTPDQTFAIDAPNAPVLSQGAGGAATPQASINGSGAAPADAADATAPPTNGN